MQQRRLPRPPQAFTAKKTRILQQLAAPDAEYADLSPKGSVDSGIRPLIDEINCADGFVTTSSCAGRVSVFLEGERATSTGVGGKGGGGTWLYVSHDAVDGQDWLRSLGLEDGEVPGPQGCRGGRLIHFKFEPMLLLRSALQAGFRESGAVSLTSGDSRTTGPMVAVRSMGLGFESLIGCEVDGRRCALVSASYLRTLMDIGNERFEENTRRIERFRSAFRDDLASLGTGGPEWEDAAARRERMRAEGLLRRKDASARAAVGAGDNADDNADDLYQGIILDLV
ncbi:tRNA wybutosine-synthesizing protein [Metarhizium album ARSEF 1941]|uniref:tRNA(Phe) 7-[(3-amino-3-carboxypropyl)-4-demethylwyosine(37)-N(4)]-methyltransferase n=1 Tax=Metarhizium album (strain ARSEF 1941) TaxID=1081103 RepID=A0A0B2X3B8_METAS|nr:tRNA wybutosine-synthesizing protein [Metarhizium album ARSEF 1941]KHO00233.1 tRNA wybutosine-synthesizing protein [Metarhizium album ARSEF 1941]